MNHYIKEINNWQEIIIMLIEEIINEKEFGAFSRGKAALGNLGRRALGAMGSTKMYNKAIKGKVQQAAMKGANKVSDAYTRWLAARFPDQDPNFLNSDQFKEFMKTSNILKGEEAKGFPIFKGLPTVQAAMKKTEPTNFDSKIKSEIFMAIAMAQNIPGGSQGDVPLVKGATTDPKDLQQIQTALDGMSDAQMAAVINMASQQLKR